MNTVRTTEQSSDQELLEQSRLGDREAFGELVRRHQNLVCGLAFAHCGDRMRSEDLAQETFVAGWRQLPQLRDPSRFKSWLCGMVRLRAAGARREARRDPTASAECWEDCAEASGTASTPVAEVVAAEEGQMVWKALAELPEIYREPLVLFYRDGQSVTRVAQDLELSEDAIKQRLARGRDLLRGRLATLAEEILGRSGPNPAFSGLVLAALPLSLPSTGAAALVTGSADGSWAAVGGGSWLTVLGPVLGLVGAWVGIRASLQNAGSEAERRLVKRLLVTCAVLAIAFGTGLLGLFWLGRIHWGWTLGQWAVAVSVWSLLAMVAFLTVGVHWERRRRHLVTAEKRSGTRSIPHPAVHWRYQSKRRWLGWPLVDVHVGGSRRGVARGWLAIGDLAVGVVAFGGVAIGGIALGGVTLGGIAVGGAAVGLLAVGGLALGGGAVGGLAVGGLAFGGAALAVKAASGGMALAQEVAVGGLAQAAHANDASAREWIAQSGFFRTARFLVRWLPLLSLLPMLLPLWIHGAPESSTNGKKHHGGTC